MERYLIKVLGRVQGVGFRYFAQSLAGTYSITGTVKNCEDATVRIEAQGEEKNLNKFLAEIRKGNRFVKVEDIVAKKIPTADNEKSFKIVY
ncbi:acylphosphatase [Clostridium acetobutylicum]|nr:Acylphosphatase, ACYP [Clostridium acetobutylicum EA 2018]NOV88100.1 acylphosphatase [Clostridium acetobutylicum]NOW13557.1 acylphosphatase [Clostridium acetobutylicum]NRY55932.1 acylphosphatase [Clostridium acetobutylicum]NSA92219.1 acylphosphatase [Clostridium acetobutylicum]